MAGKLFWAQLHPFNFDYVFIQVQLVLVNELQTSHLVNHNIVLAFRRKHAICIKANKKV